MTKSEYDRQVDGWMRAAARLEEQGMGYGTKFRAQRREAGQRLAVSKAAHAVSRRKSAYMGVSDWA